MSLQLGPEVRGILLVEGKEDQAVLGALMEVLGIKEETIHFQVAGGKTHFTKWIKTISLMSEIQQGKVKFFGVLQDADHSAQSAMQSLNDMLKKHFPNTPTNGHWVKNPQCTLGCFILGKEKGTGSLEDLLMEASARKDELACAENYIICCEEKGVLNFNRSKAKFVSFLAVQNKKHKKVEGLVDDNAFDFNSPVFNELKAFLKPLLN